jgi:cytochrome c biogenesis protein CcdA
MKRSTVWIAIAAGIVLLFFGLACLNFTKASALERHREFAWRHNLPQPGNSILWGGAGAIAFGAALIGYAAGAKRKHASLTH